MTNQSTAIQSQEDIEVKIICYQSAQYVWINKIIPSPLKPKQLSDEQIAYNQMCQNQYDFFTSRLEELYQLVK